MARGRMVNTTIALDPEFNAMSAEAQLCFLRTVPHLDRDGLIIGQPAALWATIAPLMPGLLASMPSVIDEWKRAGLIVVFDTKIGPVLYFDGFHRNQIGIRYDREPASRLPLPEGYERTADGIKQVSGKVPESIRQPSGNDPLEVEVEVEVEGGDRACVTEPPPAEPEFPPPSEELPPNYRNGIAQANGHPRDYRRREKADADEYTDQARLLGIAPEQFTDRINRLAAIVGKRSYLDAAPHDDRTLNEIKDGVLTLARLGYHTEADYRQLAESFATINDWMERPIPTLKQFVDHAAAVKDGVTTKPRAKVPRANANGFFDFPTMAAAKAAAATNGDIRNRVTVKGTKVSI